MLRYSCNNDIIMVTNIAILELLSARFVYPGAPQLTILSFFSHELEVTRITKANKHSSRTFLNVNLLLKYFFFVINEQKLILYFFLTTMTSELSKYLTEQLDVF